MKYTVTHTATNGKRTIGIKRTFTSDTMAEAYEAAMNFAYLKALMCKAHRVQHKTTVKGETWQTAAIINP